MCIHVYTYIYIYITLLLKDVLGGFSLTEHCKP